MRNGKLSKIKRHEMKADEIKIKNVKFPDGGRSRRNKK